MPNDPSAEVRGLIALPETMEEVGCDPHWSGLFVDRRGRLSLVIEGRGLRASFGGSADLAIIGEAFTRLAARAALDERGAAETAAGELDRITAAAATRPAK